MQQKDPQNPQAARLMEILDAAAARQGHDLVQMAAQLRVTYGYLSQVRQGMRHVDDLSVAFARACARYAGVSLDHLLSHDEPN